MKYSNGGNERDFNTLRESIYDPYIIDLDRSVLDTEVLMLRIWDRNDCFYSYIPRTICNNIK